MFLGKFYNCIDSKGRMIVPAKLREQLGSEYVITIGIDKCLDVYTAEDFRAFAEKLEKLPISDDAARDFRRYFFSNAVDGEVDKQGRLTISSELKEYAGIEKDLVTIGNLNKIEIWNKDAWEARQSSSSTPSERAKKMGEYGL